MKTTTARKVILHIGYGKTGTTAIQTSLGLNRKSLLSEGICYPDLRQWGVRVGLINHNLFAWAATGKPTWISMNDYGMLQAFDKEATENGAQCLLLSAEALVSEPHPWLFSRARDFWAAQRAKLQRLRELFSDREVNIIVYLRRQDLWLESVMNHQIKLEKLSSGLPFQGTERFAQAISPLFEYNRVLNLWGDFFGTGSLEVVPFERRELHMGTVVNDFYKRLGISGSISLKSPTWNWESRNTRLPRDLLEFKKIMNSYSRPKHEERFLVQTLQNIASEFSSAPYAYAPLATTEQRQRLLEDYDSTNKEVAHTYLGREDGVLFREPWPAEASGLVSYPGLSPDRAIKILIRVQKRRNTLRGYFLVLALWAKPRLRYKMPIVHALLRALFRSFRLLSNPPSPQPRRSEP